MSELTIVVDDLIGDELKTYLISINGIIDVEINDGKQLNIYIKYDSGLISYKIIKMEVLLFLNCLKVPTILSFDKHSKEKTIDYTIIRDDICCEYCFKGSIEDLFDIEGIEKVESNFIDNYFNRKYDEREKYIINIKYNPNVISSEEIKQAELQLNI